ncbi:M1 family metallopeptidase [Nocardioides sp. AN3]
MRRGAALALALTLAAGAAACSDRADTAQRNHQSASASASTATTAASYADARSTPVEDSVYPEVGDPSVDALHYALDLSWDKPSKTLTGHETLLFRATTTGDHVQLDLSAAMVASKVTLDGTVADVDHPGKDLVVHGRFVAGHDYTLALTYAGTPTPVAMPSSRRDTPTLGLTVDDQGGLWTMQEPYGAFTWYAVNDQPADKALYDISIDAPAPMVGVSNGTLTHRSTQDGRTKTAWHLDEPAAAYLITLAVGPYQETTATGPGGLPISYWTTADDAELLHSLQQAPMLLGWLEKRLGPFPFGSLGFVLVDGDSGMETQTMITLGRDPADSEPDVLIHEMAHQWYGDEVTPSDWRDVWMNEGMAMYLQGAWQDEDWDLPPGDSFSTWNTDEIDSRRTAGPPGAYKRDHFAELNVYYGPALMWERLRRMVGDDTFWRLVRQWPAVRAEGSTGRDDYLAWIQQQTGRDLRSFFQQWLMSPRSPLQR